jgi:hypothetical protein
MKEVYINEKLSQHFNVPYMNKGCDFVVHTDALRDSFREWDKGHLKLFQNPKLLILLGSGYGWWRITNL